MSDLPSRRQPHHDDSEPVDLNSLLADERAFDLLAGRACDPADIDDRTLALLAAWGDQVRRGEYGAAPSEPVVAPRRSGILCARARGSLAGVAVTLGLLGVGSGVAAAVTGDPLAGLRGFQVAAVDSVNGHDAGTALRLSDQAVRARIALKEAAGQARSGNVEAARTITQHAQEVMQNLPAKERAVLSSQATAVEAAVGMAAAPASAASTGTVPAATSPTSSAATTAHPPAAPSPMPTTVAGSQAPTTAAAPPPAHVTVPHAPPPTETPVSSSATTTPSTPATTTVETVPTSPPSTPPSPGSKSLTPSSRHTKSPEGTTPATYGVSAPPTSSHPVADPQTSAP